jgi:dephospho-CoA kinase
MVILGLTGSIGMGKSTAGKMLMRMGVPVYDADAEVHKLLAKGGGAVGAIAKAFPGVVKDGAVDRQALGAAVFGKPEELRRLEAIIHPRVRRAQRRFLQRCARARVPVVVLDIPLLFETGGERHCDATILVTAPPSIQRARVLQRPGMTPEKLRGILDQQMSDHAKRLHADFVVNTGLDKGRTMRHLRAIVDQMRNVAGRHWPPRSRSAPKTHR